MEIVKSQSGDKIVFTLSGRLDTAAAPQFQEALISAFNAATCVELDLANLNYVSSAGLRVLLLGEKTAKSKDGTMILVNVMRDVKEIFEMTGFSDILKIV